MEQSLNNILKSLIKPLACASICYIPKNIFQYIDADAIRAIDPDFINRIGKILLIDKDGFHIEDFEAKSALIVMSKTGLLQNNIFTLSQLKDNNGKEVFNYIIKK